MTRTVLTEAAEQARSDIRLLQAEHMRASKLRAQGFTGRVPGFEPTTAQRATQLALTTVIAVAEHFSARRLRAIQGATENDISSWPKQEAAWLTHADVKLGNLLAYEPLRGFNEARNAILHGRGQLTPRQLASPYADKVRVWLSAAAIKSVRDRLIISDSDLDRCADVCAEFIRQLDSVAPQLPPDVAVPATP